MVISRNVVETGLSEQVAMLAEQVQASVVLVRGSRFGAGSGVIWNGRGLVVTNHHVVPGQHAEVVLGSGARVSARVVRRAERLDLVALQIDGPLPISGLVPVAIGDSGRLRIGELVLAVGNPLGERNAATLGIVAANAAGAIRLAITLRPGNSGGALANARGEVVGIPNLVIGGDLALAVPSRVVQEFLE